MRVRAVILFAFLNLSFYLQAQDTYRVMDWKTEYTLRTYLLQCMHQQYDQRRQELGSAMKSEAGITEYRALCREKYMRLLGEMPRQIPLNSQIIKRMDRGSYVVENIIIESRPGHHVTANLYLPEAKNPSPAVLLFCGHEMTSKATESYQKTAILFALNGFVVLVVDPISQGERVQFTDSLGIRILRGSTTEHTLLNAGANLVGSGVVAWGIYDNIRSLDYLASRPEVDPQRIGCLGNSGGGTQTAYFIGFDERIKVAAPCSYIARRERNFELSGASDGCQHIPFEGEEQLEIADFLIMFSPKPLLILAGRYDFVDYSGTVETFRELENVYHILGADNKVKLFTFDDGHGISRPKREAAVEWFKLWLYNEKGQVREDNIEVLDEASLNCTSTGQVNSFFSDEKDVQHFNLQAANDLAESRSEFLNTSSLIDKQHKIRDLLAIDDNEFPVTAEIKSEERQTGFSVTKLILRREGEVPLPCLKYTPDKQDRKDTLVIWLFDGGKDEIASSSPRLLTFMKEGIPVILADLRGMGETSEDPEANEWKYYNREYHNAMLSLHIGKPLTGQRINDILTLMKYISGDDRLKKMDVKIIASGAASVPALYAAVLSPDIAALELSLTIMSYYEILEKPMERDWYTYVIPGVLKFFDLPDVAKMRADLEIRYK